MAANEFIIDQIISRFDNNCIIEPFLLEISEPKININTKNDILILSNDKIDIPLTAKLIINSDDNVLITSKAEFNEWQDYKNQRFTKNISIELQNYGVNFIPFQLEFMRIIPIPPKQCKKTKTTTKC